MPALANAVSPWLEMGAYEDIWTRTGISFKTISQLFRTKPEQDRLPSAFVAPDLAKRRAYETREILNKSHVDQFGLRIYGMLDYPRKLRDADHPVELLYFQGNWDLVSTRCVAIVGTRTATQEGKARAAKLVRQLVKDDFTIVSGLARGIDTEAHTTAIAHGGRTIAVIGTPLSHSYPPENSELQQTIARDFLLVSQVPVIRYSYQHPPQNKFFFPERNITMSALTEATIIVEAGETSGALTQARAALNQGRKLFILDSCFQNAQLTWPSTFERVGAIRVKDYSDIEQHLAASTHQD
jgi:DNA processing protein